MKVAGSIGKVGIRVRACCGDALEAQRGAEEQRGADRAVHQVKACEFGLGLGLAVVTRWKHKADEKSSEARTERSTKSPANMPNALPTSMPRSSTMPALSHAP